jgi:NADPH2:quinone reductase
VSADKAEIVKGFGATPIDYRSVPVDEYIAVHTEGRGFDIVYDTVGGTTLDASFAGVKRHTGHVVSCLGWGSHSLRRCWAHHDEILALVATLVEAGRVKPLIHEEREFGEGSRGDVLGRWITREV